ncbi:MAG TPA: hypothetical protein VIE16_05905 [Phenylobacterium sp.]|jgi:hypothetical protein
MTTRRRTLALLGATAALALAGFQKPAEKPAAAASHTAHAGTPAPSACDTPTTPFCDSTPAVGKPPNWNGPLFHLSQQYPAAAPKDAQPWLAFDPKTQPEAYLRSVLAYFYEGNVRPDVARSFDPALNTVRHWYNAPWQDYGFNGREPIHGLTRERPSLPGELAATQKSIWNNYAVGFYNAPGGVAIGRVWANHGAPNAAAAGDLPEGTVAAKLLFTTASVAEVPFLAGSPTWNAYVYAALNDPLGKAHCDDPPPTVPAKPPRAVTPVRLLQIDIGVKDKRAGPTGWIFGTFVYGGGPGGPAGSGWTHVDPVGVMWGNDPGYSGSGPLKETWLNPKVHMLHVGFQGRLNGPVDNPSSACISCHMTAESPMDQSMTPACNAKPPATDPWFRDLPAGQPFAPGHQSTDDSLQVAVGLANFRKAHAPPTKALLRNAAGKQAGRANSTDSPREGGPLE